MKKNVLIVGSGGCNKYDYLSWLNKLGANVILLEPLYKKENLRKKTNWTTFYADFTDINSVINKAKRINSKFLVYTVDTIFEVTMEHAAEIRKVLSVSGITPRLLRYGRNKTIMAEFMKENNIRTAPFITFHKNDDLTKVQKKMKKFGNIPWILKPDNLGANIGVRKMKTFRDFPDVFNDAQRDILNNPYKEMVYYDTTAKWIICKFIRGYEVETEVCIHKGKVIFSAYLLKTVSVEREQGIEENRYITPPPWLTKKQLKDLYIQIERISKAIYEQIMKPCGKETLVIHPEFRIDDKNNAYTLEFAFRNGGGLNPYRIEENTGINPYYLSAAATLNMRPEIKNCKIKMASGYQMIFSDRQGEFECLKGIKKSLKVRIKREVVKGHKICVPHAEPLVSIIATAKTPEKVDEILNSAVKNAKIYVSGEEIEVPVSSFV